MSKQKFKKKDPKTGRPIETPDNYIRVGIEYFKVITKTDRFGTEYEILKKWNESTIRTDQGKMWREFITEIPKYDDFVLVPDNKKLDRSVGFNYNLYAPFPHKPKKGKLVWSTILMNHIFGDQVEMGWKYLKVLYDHPEQPLPILALISQERMTGKTTFIDWMNAIFGSNVAMIDPDVLGSTFNSEYAYSNIICVDETFIEKNSVVEKIKGMVTKKHISVNMKNVIQFKVPFYAKIILASNNEKKFIKVDQDEIRFWVRQIPMPTEPNHQIMDDLVSEIPALLYHLNQMDPVDRKGSRQVFDAALLQNKWLEQVKQESKTSLFHEMMILFQDMVNNWGSDEQGMDVVNGMPSKSNEILRPETLISFAPVDIKQQWFSHNNRFSGKYIKSVIVDEMELDISEKKRYKPLDQATTKTGTPYQIRVDDLQELIQNGKVTKKYPPLNDDSQLK